jgi:hypothetical protein
VTNVSSVSLASYQGGANGTLVITPVFAP